MSVMCLIDDKYIPLYRVLWVASTPHFCGEADCQCEGAYEIRLEPDESIWARNQKERDGLLQAIESWQGGSNSSPDERWD